jgi:hypothetical protein
MYLLSMLLYMTLKLTGAAFFRVLVERLVR